MSVIRRLLRPWCVRWIALPVLIVLAVHAGWTLVLAWRFEARLSELRAAGEPADFQDLVPPLLPAEENAVALLLEAERFYEAQLGEPPLLPLDEEDWVTEEDRAAMQEWLAKAEPYRELLVRAAAKPALRMDLDWEEGVGMRVPTAPIMCNAVEYLDYRIRYGEADVSESVRDAAVMLGLASKLEQNPLMQIAVRWTIESVAARAVTVIARRPGFQAAAVRAALDPGLAAAVRAERPLIRKALQGDRAAGLRLARRWISGESPTVFLRELTGDEDEPDGEPGVSDWFYGSWFFRPIAYGDALRFLELMGAQIDLVDLQPREALKRSKSLEEKYAGQLPWLISSAYARAPPDLYRERLRHRAQIRMVRTGLALLELRQRSGAWPRDLAPVVPLVGAEAIVDPFTGGQLAYEPGARLEAAAPIPYPDLPEEYEIVWRFR